MMMSLTERESQALGSIADGLAGSDPRLASMLNIFSRLAAGEQMPAREQIRIRRGWPPAPPRRARRHPRRGTAARKRARCTRAWAGAIDRNLPRCFSITRADLAACMLSALVGPATIHRHICTAN